MGRRRGGNAGRDFFGENFFQKADKKRATFPFWGPPVEKRKEEALKKVVNDEAFCRAYLRTMDPDRAAYESGLADGYAPLESRAVEKRLERMRSAAVGQLRREDALRRLAQLAFGRANDAAKLALRGAEADPDTLDLSAVSEIRVTDKGGVEIKLVDRVRALEALLSLLENGGGAQALYQALAAAAGPEDAGDD